MGKNRKSSGGTGGSQSESTELTWQSVKDDPEKIAELTGWKFTTDEYGNYDFYDKENDFHLKLTKETLDELKDSHLMLNRMVQVVYNLPDMNKQVTPNMYIVSPPPFRNGVYGQHMSVSNKSTKEILGHGVAINSSLFVEDDPEVMRVMLHETNHALDYIMGGATDKSSISHSKQFKNALKLDGPSTGYGESYKYKKDKFGRIIGEYAERTLYTKDSKWLTENYAEAGSIVQMKKLGYGNEKIVMSNAQLKQLGYGTKEKPMPEDNSITVNEWCDTHTHVYEVVNDFIDDYDNGNFGKPNVSHPMIEEMYSNNIL